MSYSPQNDDSIFLKYVGANVRQFRTSRKLNVGDLSVRSGISYGIIARVEDGAADICLNELAAIARALDVPTVALVEIHED